MNGLSNLTNRVAVANHGGAMEQRNHFKNGDSPKIQGSKANFMRKYFVFIFICLILFACNDDPKKQLLGVWKEHWGVGQESDVTYNDTIKIHLSKNDEIILKCINRDYYTFDSVLFDGIELSFRIENTNDFYINYKIKLSDNRKWIEGTAQNSNNETVYVKWEKIK